MPERNLVSWNTIIGGYAQNGHVDEALNLFQRMPVQNVVSWNTMIAGYSQNGYFNEALEQFRQMQLTNVKPNSVSFASVLPACANLGALEQGKGVHEEIIRSGFHSEIIVGNTLIDMYAKCGSIENALRVFDKMPDRDVVSCTAMIAGYAQNGLVDEALKLFQKMCGRNMVSWNLMIAVFTQNGHFNKALKLFQQMQWMGVKPNSVTFATVLPACASLAALEYGRRVHEDIIRSGFHCDVFIGNALVDMYAKCGSIDDACKVFNKMPRQNVVSWTSMIVGYAMHGCGEEALRLFQRMQNSGLKPDHVTFIGVLSACCHTGLVDVAWQHFHSMSRDYHITPAAEHYCCMIDVLGRAGHLDAAIDLINKMPLKPDAAVWVSLLGACRIHNNIKVGEYAAECLVELNPKNAAHYVLLSNMYAAAGKWDDVEKVRKMMKERKVKKRPGCSWIEINNKVYTFHIGNRSHPQMNELSAKLEWLSGLMKEAGYVPDINFVLHDVEYEQKEHILCHHSEKLAIMFGLIHTEPGTLIRIVKNLRVCGDCHSAAKFISKIVEREIMVRDVNRFHHFKHGQCSCGDYW